MSAASIGSAGGNGSKFGEMSGATYGTPARGTISGVLLVSADAVSTNSAEEDDDSTGSTAGISTGGGSGVGSSGNSGAVLSPMRFTCNLNTS
jgi:hypothetical protein